MKILGVSCFFHDSAACLVIDGKVVAAVSEERFSRKKQDAGLPKNAINYCLKLAGGSVDYVVYYERIFLKLERVLTWILATVPKSFLVFRDVVFAWLGEKMWVMQMLVTVAHVGSEKVLSVPHHLSHAASTFLCSSFNEATIVTIDGVGEWSTATIGMGTRDKNGKPQIRIIKELRYPDSLGLLYSTFTAFLGFEVNEGEYKVMGMSAYGVPRFKNKIYNMVKVFPDGSLKLDLSYFAFHYHRTTSYSQKFLEEFGKPRDARIDYIVGSKKAQYYADIAASIQAVCEEILLKMAKFAKTITVSDNLCLAGGVALNSVANYKLLQSGIFRNIYIQPAAGDAGGSLGAALYADGILNPKSKSKALPHAYLGKQYSHVEIRNFLEKNKLKYRQLRSEKQLVEFVVEKLKKQKVVAWMQGKFEWGPRALGNRSIIADARNPKIKDIVNSKIKFRELFRPFAPSVLAERADEIFEVPQNYLRQQPFDYMLFVVPVRRDKRKLVPAITHVNGTARPQFVHKKTNPLYHKLISEFNRQTGVPLILNTSFNLKGEPIVDSPEDAYSTFTRSHLDYLVMGNFVLDRSALVMKSAETFKKKVNNIFT